MTLARLPNPPNTYEASWGNQYTREIERQLGQLDDTLTNAILILDTSTRSLANITELEALTDRPDVVIVQGSVTPGDGAGGLWWWEAGSTTTPDGILVVEPTDGEAGRYKLLGLRFATADIIGNLDVGADLDVVGDATLGTLDVAGAAAIGTTLDVTGNTTLGGTLGVVSDVTVASGKIILTDDANGIMEIGAASATPTIHFHSGATPVTYDARIVGSGGTGSNAGGTLTTTARLKTFTVGVTFTVNTETVTFNADTAYNFQGTGTVAFAGAPTFLNTTAAPSGGTAGSGIKLSSTSNFGMFWGSGAPTLSAAQGSLYLRRDGSSTSTRLYVNTNGTTGWTNVTTAA